MQKKAGKFPRLFMLSLVSFCAWFSANRAAPLFDVRKKPYKSGIIRLKPRKRPCDFHRNPLIFLVALKRIELAAS